MGEARIEIPCEYAARQIFPSIRATIARLLVEEFKISRYTVAKILGITPAAITNYLEGRRGDKRYETLILGDEKLRRYARRAASILLRLWKSKDPSMKKEYHIMICNICSRINELALENGCPATHFQAVTPNTH